MIRHDILLQTMTRCHGTCKMPQVLHDSQLCKTQACREIQLVGSSVSSQSKNLGRRWNISADKHD